MKKIIFCQTPFQIIVALYIKHQYTKNNDQVDLVITNTFVGYDKLIKKLSSKKIFNNIYIANVKELILAKGINNNLKKLYYVLIPSRLVKKIWPLGLEDYDEMYCWNYDAFTASIRSYIELKKGHIKIIIFDEGYISYFPINEVIPKHGFIKIIELRNKIFGIPQIVRDNIDGIMLFNPDLLIFTPTCPIYKLDINITNSDFIRETVDYLFDVKDIIKKYDKKYIIFEEAMIAEHTNFDDEKLFDNIVSIVGKENVIIKLHPRTKNDRFSEKGIKTLGSDGVPWEAISLVGDFSNNTFVAIGSGSITTYRMLFGNKMNAYMLFKIANPNLKQFDNKFIEFWNKIESHDDNFGIHIPKSEKGFYKMIKKEGVNNNENCSICPNKIK